MQLGRLCLDDCQQWCTVCFEEFDYVGVLIVEDQQTFEFDRPETLNHPINIDFGERPHSPWMKTIGDPAEPQRQRPPPAKPSTIAKRNFFRCGNWHLIVRQLNR